MFLVRGLCVSKSFSKFQFTNDWKMTKKCDKTMPRFIMQQKSSSRDNLRNNYVSLTLYGWYHIIKSGMQRVDDKLPIKILFLLSHLWHKLMLQLNNVKKFLSSACLWLHHNVICYNKYAKYGCTRAMNHSPTSKEGTDILYNLWLKWSQLKEVT